MVAGLERAALRQQRRQLLIVDTPWRQHAATAGGPEPTRRRPPAHRSRVEIAVDLDQPADAAARVAVGLGKTIRG